MHPRVIIMSGPSGVGKSTLVKEALATYPDLMLSVSLTTRSPRNGEVNGIHYHFVTREQFEQRIADGDFLEWAEVYGNFYGTSKSHIKAMLFAGKSVLLDIDTQGALAIQKHCQGVSYVFIRPPSLEALADRLKGRGTETEETLERRLAAAEKEIAQSDQYDHVLVNDDLGQTSKAFLDLLGKITATPATFQCGEPS